MNEKTQGWINLYKPSNISSNHALTLIKKKFRVNKIGHAGTLDPLAEGILPIAVGQATKLVKFISNYNKKYIFKIKWGEQTSTDDSEGYVIKSSSKIPKRNDLKKKLSKFIGYIDQIPPAASAIKINGVRAYKLFRKNQNFELKSRKVYVKKTKLLKTTDYNFSTIEIECGKGFYVRSLARDLALSLGAFGHVSYLKRAKIGNFDQNSAILLDDLLKIGQTHFEFNCIHTSMSMLDDILAYEIENKEDQTNLSFGRSIYLDLKKFNKPPLNSTDDKIVFLSKKGNVVSYGKLDGNLFKPKKIFI
ncbi:MAG: tRNA pseudouridine(55) synthase TruB [Pelagibacteraceae bacterium]|nr:tRNA pseudouridine(55) synthase TruB [Pelagibacteraceae bacterium]|tara:strand:+ start:16324 stop:17235 length:912 start_codon:yes stop_codon:yes gene_type:complete